MLKDTNSKKSHDFNLINCDTDAIMINKSDQSNFTKEERYELIKEINSLLPEKIRFEDNGYFSNVIVTKAKNYILQTEDGKIKYKGSSIKATTKELALQTFIKDIIDSILNDKKNYVEIYHSYVREILKLTDIKRWASKKTITSKVMNNTRTNEVKVREAIEGSEYKEGDKAYFFYNSEDNLVLAENFNNDYNKEKLLSKLYKTTKTFETIIDESIFVNYSLKKNYKYFKEYGILIGE